MRAVEESHALETRMPVEVVAPPGQDVQALHRRARPLEGAAAGRARRRLCQGSGLSAAPRSKVTKTSSAPMLGPLREETWAVVGEDGHLLMPPRRRYEPGVVKLLVENLEKVARHRLTPGPPERGERAQGEGRRRAAAQGRLQPGGSGGRRRAPGLYEGENMAFRISASRTRQPLFVYLLDLGLTGRIKLLYPPPGAEDSLLPGRDARGGDPAGARDQSLHPR